MHILFFLGLCISLYVLFYKPKLACQLIEYEFPPDDSDHPPNETEASTIEHFRISGGRRSGGGGSRGGSGGSSGGRGGGSGGRYWNSYGSSIRPWRSYLWRSYPYYYDYNYPYYYGYDYTNSYTPTERFTVRVGQKNDSIGFMINSSNNLGCGDMTPTLNLKYGTTYEFDVFTDIDCVTGEQRDAPFFFTADKEGGQHISDIFNINPTNNGTIRFTATQKLPNKFYYQSIKDKNVGGLVIMR